MSHKHIGICSLFVCASIAGCSSDSGPVTSQTSKYEVADESTDGVGTASPNNAGPALNPPTNADVAEKSNTPVTGGRPGVPDQTTAPERPKPLAGNPDHGSRPTAESGAPVVASEADGPAELLAMIQKLASQRPSGLTTDEVALNMQKTQRQIIQAADMILKMKATDEQTLAAAQAKVGALQEMARAGADSVTDELLTLAADLKARENEDLAQFGQQLAFSTLLDDFSNSDNTDATQIIADFKTLFATLPKDDGALGFGFQVAQRLMQKELNEETVDVLRFTAAGFEEGDDENLKAGAEQLLEQASFVEVGFYDAVEAMLEEKEGSEEALLEAVNTLVAAEPRGAGTLTQLVRLAGNVESSNVEFASKIYDALETGFSTHEKEQVAEEAKETVEMFRLRSSLVGKPFSVEGVLVDESPFDWAKYKGKVVLVDFWATWCRPCLEEIPNVEANYKAYHEQGFEVVGVNIDQDVESLKRFLQFQKLPWPSVISADPDATHPMIAKCGVTTIPFLVLVNREGTAVATTSELRGEALGKKLAEIFGDPEPSSDSETPASEKPDSDTEKPAEKPADDAEAAEKDSGEAKPDAGDTSQATVGEATAFFFASFNEQDAAESGEQADSEENELDLDGVNPYSARPDLSPEQLVDFLFDMQEKPKSIQRRAGFAEAIVDAADRILAADTKEKYHVIATVTKLETLHKKAVEGSDAFDGALKLFADELKDDARAKIAREVAFYRLERKVLEADELDKEALPDLLAEVHRFVKDRKLQSSHLRLASATVGAINRLEDLAEREKYFKQFGESFAKSRDKEVARYGRRIAKTKPRKAMDLVGKPLELAGPTDFGTPLDWASYRGRVVLVDFWATWCGPCRREMPKVTALHRRLQDKGFEVVAVSLDEDLEALAKYLEENKVSWTNLIGGEAREAAKRLGIAAIPTMLVVDPDGRVAAVGHKVAELEDKIEQLLAQKS